MYKCMHSITLAQADSLNIPPETPVAFLFLQYSGYLSAAIINDTFCLHKPWISSYSNYVKHKYTVPPPIYYWLCHQRTLGFYCNISTSFVPFMHEYMPFFKVSQPFWRCHITSTHNHFCPEDTIMKARLDCHWQLWFSCIKLVDDRSHWSCLV